jgi:hypothetical protein
LSASRGAVCKELPEARGGWRRVVKRRHERFVLFVAEHEAAPIEQRLGDARA